jgi:GTP cyclohydrolase II
VNFFKATFLRGHMGLRESGARSPFCAPDLSLRAVEFLLTPTRAPFTDYTNTEPPISVPHNPAWDDRSKIVTLDPYGHLVPQVFKSYLDAGIDARPTIAITRAHIKLNDFDEAVRAGELEVDGKIVVRTPTDWINQNRANSAAAKTAREADDVAAQHMAHAGFDAGVEINVSKVACENVWYLPGVAERFGVSEGTLRRALFEETGGMYPELLTRHDLKTFLPPIGGLTVYIVRLPFLHAVRSLFRPLTVPCSRKQFGNPDYLRDESKELTLRVHDECNGSDVFGS